MSLPPESEPESRPDESHTIPAPPPGSRFGSGTRGETRDYQPPTDGTVAQSPASGRRSGEWSARGAARPAAVPGYELLEEVGRGGMGVVYKARQVSLNRTVALKMVLGADRAAPADVARFLAEAEAVAAIDHPHVVRVYEFGDPGTPYFAMEYLDGGSLSGLIREKGKLRPADAARLVADLANGVQAAHDLGIVHRDLKPSNVLFDHAGAPKVTDFGLAKRAGADLTQTNAVMGTPAYMAPEQAAGNTKFVGPAADIYALGVILFECLAGRPPFQADDAVSLIRKVVDEEPTPVRHFSPGTPRDLELICARCLAKRPHERYPTAKALADDLRHFLAGEPVSVRAATAPERLLKWARRKPTLAAAYGLTAVSVLLAGLVGGAVWLWQRAEAARGVAVGERGRADEARAAAESEREAADASRDRAEAEQRRAEAAGREAGAARDRVEKLNALRSVDLAYREWRSGSPAEARRLLGRCPDELRGWEWGFVSRLMLPPEAEFHGPAAVANGLAVSPDGTRVAVGWLNGQVDVFDLATSRRVMPAQALKVPILAAHFTPDGRAVRVTTVQGWVELDAATGTVRRSAPLASLAFAVFDSRDGRRRVTAAPPFETGVKVWDTEANKPVCTLAGHTGLVIAYGAFSADNRRVVTVSEDKTARVWDAETGKLLHTLAGHGATVHAAAFSPDGKRVATASLDHTATVWDAETGAAVCHLVGHADGVVKVAFSPDGRRVATAGFDRTARVWDAGTGDELVALRDFLFHTSEVAFTPDSRRLVTGTRGVVQVWDVLVNPDRHPLLGPPGEEPISALGKVLTPISGTAAFSPNGKVVVGGWYGAQARVWDAHTGRAVRTWEPHSSPVTAVGFVPGRDLFLTGSQGGTVKVWDDKGGVVATFDKHGKMVTAVVGLAGDRVASAGGDEHVRVWEARTGKELHSFAGFKAGTYALAAAADGSRVAGGVEGGVRVWDVGTGREVAFHPTKRGWGAVCLAFSPDGKLLACGDEAEVVVWEADRPGREVFRSPTQWSAMFGVAFSPDGRRLASAAAGGPVKVWDTETWYEACTLRPDAGLNRAVAFSPDGDRLLVSGSTHPVVFGMPARVPPEPAPPPREK